MKRSEVCRLTTAHSRQSARLLSEHRAISHRCAPPAAEAERWAGEADSERKTLKMGPARPWLPSSPMLSPAAPRCWPGDPLVEGGTLVGFSRWSSAPQAVGKQYSGPSSCSRFRSAGADIRLGGLWSRRSRRALGHLHGGRRLLRRHAGFNELGIVKGPGSTKRCGQHLKTAPQPRRAADNGRAHLESLGFSQRWRARRR